MERRSAGAAWQASEEGYTVEGYAATFGTSYDMGGCFEVIDARCLDGAAMDDVVFLYDHCGMVLARTSNGSLSLSVDAHGLLVRADLGGTEQGRQLHAAVRAGLVTKMSWSFTVADDGWGYDRATRTSTVERVERVYDVSAVGVPANDATSISARSYLASLPQADEREDRALARARASATAATIRKV